MPKINQAGYEGRSATATVAGIVKLSEVGGNVPAATTSVAGKAALATQAEVNTGTVNNKIVTPLTLKTNLTTPPPIGSVTPNTGAFTNLTVTGTATFVGTTLLGAVNINNSGSGITTIGTGGTGATNIGNATGGTAITGPVTVSTTLGVTALSTLAATNIVGTTNINISGAAITTIGTGGTGATRIGNATGNTAVTGSLTATTTLTATLGNITATNGNLSLATAGNKIVIATGSNASVGTSGVMAGTPGVVTVATTACSITAKVFYCRATTGGTPGNVSITAQDETGFTLTSTGNETSTFNWWIINA